MTQGMNTMMNRMLALVAVCVQVLALRAQSAEANALTDFHADSLSMRLTYVLAGDPHMGSNYAVCYTPVLTNGRGDSLQLQPLTFRGRRNMRYVQRGRFYQTLPQAAAPELPLNASQEQQVTLLRRDYPWLWQGRISLTAKAVKEGCCDVIPLPDSPMGSFAWVPPFVPVFSDVADNTGKAGELQHDNPVLQHISKYRPYDDTRILRKEKGALYVHFPLDQSTLQHDFRDNALTLDRIEQITRAIMADSTSSVKIIQIVGLASVEGPRANNVRLAGARAEALKQYIQQRVPTPDALYECVNGGEAWTELRDQIADSQFEGRNELLRIIDSDADADRKEQLIKQLHGGRPYAYLRSNVLSDQRNSGYVRIYYDYVPDTVAKVINEAVDLMKEEKYAEALALLEPVAYDKRSHGPLGVAHYMTGNEQKGVEYMRLAAADGNQNARRNMEQIEAIEATRQMK